MYATHMYWPAATREGRQQCVDHSGQPVPCCAWQPTPQASMYMGLTAVMLLWTVFLFSQVRRSLSVYMISGAVERTAVTSANPLAYALAE